MDSAETHITKLLQRRGAESAELRVELNLDLQSFITGSILRWQPALNLSKWRCPMGGSGLVKDIQLKQI
ncbi:hypothetical protein Oweho_2912 [Owenweeksia hongkongensis DSM 17368]|uniref:Uncharacterized protein n=1 Tax=Owenweeksia hongkongensis (strain DSM 17368 / CIP 108786 / JCM 12287 / NRRL B-23963 / UST20020801) TaxID=926562 RepID=G8R1C6_OWEHD|nr:hypothetical protein [Owenweeksia hongkongensis]AEV33869.1 hypothetical protein Oweho_2912 [Owenweeksia hongkongensis DSM 17368]